MLNKDMRNLSVLQVPIVLKSIFLNSFTNVFLSIKKDTCLLIQVEDSIKKYKFEYLPYKLIKN